MGKLNVYMNSEWKKENIISFEEPPIFTRANEHQWIQRRNIRVVNTMEHSYVCEMRYISNEYHAELVKLMDNPTLENIKNEVEQNKISMYEIMLALTDLYGGLISSGIIKPETGMPLTLGQATQEVSNYVDEDDGTDVEV